MAHTEPGQLAPTVPALYFFLNYRNYMKNSNSPFPTHRPSNLLARRFSLDDCAMVSELNSLEFSLSPQTNPYPAPTPSPGMVPRFHPSSLLSLLHRHIRKHLRRPPSRLKLLHHPALSSLLPPSAPARTAARTDTNSSDCLSADTPHRADTAPPPPLASIPPPSAEPATARTAPNESPIACPLRR